MCIIAAAGAQNGADDAWIYTDCMYEYAIHDVADRSYPLLCDFDWGRSTAWRESWHTLDEVYCTGVILSMPTMIAMSSHLCL